MSNLRIISNNPLARAKYGDIVEFVGGGAEDVLIRARDFIHEGSRLLIHPLSGVAPGVSPYKSLALDIAGSPGRKSGNLGNETDFVSLGLIEGAIGACIKTPDGFAGYDGTTLEDFMTVDLDILVSAIPAGR